MSGTSQNSPSEVIGFSFFFIFFLLLSFSTSFPPSTNPSFPSSPPFLTPQVSLPSNTYHPSHPQHSRLIEPPGKKRNTQPPSIRMTSNIKIGPYMLLETLGVGSFGKVKRKGHSAASVLLKTYTEHMGAQKKSTESSVTSTWHSLMEQTNNNERAATRPRQGSYPQQARVACFFSLRPKSSKDLRRHGNDTRQELRELLWGKEVTAEKEHKGWT